MNLLRSKYISNTALYFIAVAVLLTIFFELWRVVLLLIINEKASLVPAAVLWKSFMVGLRFDFAIACYICLPLYLIGFIPLRKLSHRLWKRNINFMLLIILTGIAFFIHLVDIEFFNFYNARLNGSALLWGDTPGFVISMIWEMYPVFWYLLMYVVILFLFFFLAGWLSIKLIIERTASSVRVNLLYLPLVMAIFFLGMRGRLEEKSPLRWGMAYFSEFDFANQLALNPNFTFFKDVIYNAGKLEQVEKLMEEIHITDTEIVTRQMLGVEYDSTSENKNRIVRRILYKEQNENPPNLILIIMESFGSTRIGALDNRWQYDLTPCFDSAVKRGILFTNFYSNGLHTYTGLFCSLYGYPHLFGKLIMKQVVGRYYFHGLPSILKEHGYETLFFTTHDPHFDNMQGFLKANGVGKVFSLFDYDEKDKLSTLGVPDHIMFNRAIKELRQLKGKRYFATLLTASNHGPWLIPDVPFERIPENEKYSKQLNAFKYSDWALGQFLSAVEKDSAFVNTIIVITSDNGSIYKARLDLDLTQFQIPLLIYNTDWKWSEGKRVDRLGSQMDIPATVMGLIGLDYDNYTFGHDLLDSSNDTTISDFVHLSEWYKIGYIENEYYHINRIQGPEGLYRLDDVTKDLSDSLIDLNKKYAHKALSLYQAAYYNMSRPLMK